jgi:hypothetical protein
MNDWPPHLEGACYTVEHGWHRPVRQPSGRIHHEPIPLDITRAAGLDDHPQLGEGITILVLRSEPFRNLIPRARR